MKKSPYLHFIAQIGISGAHPGGLHLTKELIAREEIDEKSSILDAGCGTGQTSAYLASTYNCEVIAIDSHSEMVKKAKSRMTHEGFNVQVMKGNLEHLPFKENTFQFVFAESVISFTNATLSLSELHRVLDQHGTLLLIEMTLESKLREIDQQTLKSFYGFNHIYTENQWITKLKESGFSNVEVLFGNTVANTISEQQPEENMTQLHLSQTIDPSLYHTWMKHEELLMKFAHLLGHRVYRCKK
jgi:ubiquinone/menaquinone biosynthesis C-methylase UbiE